MIYWILFVAIMLSPHTGEQQPLLDALEDGDVKEFGHYYADQVVVTIFDHEKTLPKTKAVAVTENFFNAHGIQGFQKHHTGTSKDGSSSYLIGTLVSEKEAYRTFIYFRMNAEVPVISEVQIER